MALTMSVTSDPVSVDLRIDTLVLEGFPSRDRYAIGDVMRAELERLFIERGVPATLRTPNRAAHVGGSFAYEPNDSADIIGRRIAVALYEGFAI
jgi:hypothetical protein